MTGFTSIKKITVTKIAFGCALAMVSAAQAQMMAPQAFDSETSLHASFAPALFVAITSDAASSSSEALPNAPDVVLANGPVLRGSVAEAAMPPGGSSPVAAKLTKYIPAGWTAQPLTAGEKIKLGIRDTYQPFSILGMIVSAGYEQAVNGSPNYGTDRGAFGQRLGAAGIRDTTDGLFTDTVFAPLLREDPRYYVEGSSHGFVQRVVYAGTRTIITRTDSGHTTINGAMLLGYAAASALSYTYYPQINKNFHDTAGTFGGSLGGAALGNIVSEFSDQLFVALHLKKKQ